VTRLEGRVLSVQSHTVHGYVGNKAATLPLQLLGLEVDPLNTVHFSTHAGYKHLRGDATTAAQYDTLIEGLRINGVLQYDYLLSGYVRSQALLQSLAATLTELRQAGPVSYFLDPVLGDEDCGFYVPEELVSVYKELMLPLATVITPNTFEAEHLSGVKIASEQDAVQACQALHALGPRIVVITSMNVPPAAGSVSSIDSSVIATDEYSDSSISGESHISGKSDTPQQMISVLASAMPDGATDPKTALVYRVFMPKATGRCVLCIYIYILYVCYAVFNIISSHSSSTYSIPY
jgi:pyridoxine kinase